MYLTGCWGTQVLPPLSRAYVARQDFLLHQEVESTKQHQESPRSTGLEHSTSVQLQFPFKRCPWNWSLKNGWFSSFWAPAVMFTKNTLWGQRAKTLPQKEQVMKWWLGGVFFELWDDLGSTVMEHWSTVIAWGCLGWVGSRLYPCRRIPGFQDQSKPFTENWYVAISLKAMWRYTGHSPAMCMKEIVWTCLNVMFLTQAVGLLCSVSICKGLCQHGLFFMWYSDYYG